MTDKQPEAMRLADVLEKEHLHTITVDMDAAKELRRLHAENERLKTERDELLAALKEIADESDSDEWSRVSTMKAREAIAEVEGKERDDRR